MPIIDFQFTPANKQAFRGDKGVITLGSYGIGSDKVPRLSGDCHCLEEVESAVDGLKRELDTVLKRARRKFKTT